MTKHLKQILDWGERFKKIDERFLREAKKELSRLESENQKMKEVLRFYAELTELGRITGPEDEEYGNEIRLGDPARKVLDEIDKPLEEEKGG